MCVCGGGGGVCVGGGIHEKLVELVPNFQESEDSEPNPHTCEESVPNPHSCEKLVSNSHM